ncbi:MAG TPA: ATP-binding protein [Herpetosiphonaceae bacterium]
MSTPAIDSWTTANQRYTQAALTLLRATLEQHTQPLSAGSPSIEEARLALDEIRRSLPAPAALEQIGTTFGLSAFERDLLLLCAGVELDSSFGPLCAAAHNDPSRPYPTFSLALACLPDAHWSALTPGSPLRRWRLIEVAAGSALTQSPLRIDERVLHHLAGTAHLDERLVGIVEPVQASSGLVPSHAALVERIVATMTEASSSTALPVIQLCGAETTDKRTIAAAACSTLGLRLSLLAADLVPTAAGDLEALICLWEREAALTSTALLLDCDGFDLSDTVRNAALTRLIERMQCVLIVATRERRRILGRPTLILDVHKPSHVEQRAIWQSALGATTAQLNGQVDTIVAQFDLSTATILAASAEALGHTPEQDAGAVIWNACRTHTRSRLDELAQRITPAAGWDDLVLPETQRQILREIVAHVRRRMTVYDTWGFAAKSPRGLGISALFAGESGTGKTLAAEVMAHELRLDLYHIDLSSVVSKYIGETEKNLRRVFDAAEEGGAILLFDEADALFGKRSEVKDSHDRYANIEVSYLLQRMEAYRGLAILTTNLKSAIDTAFLRRIRFVVQFPFPDAAQRAEIWRRIFPPATPTEQLDIAKLARLNITGGNIRNIALNAAFLAADAAEPVRMKHLLRAARTEYLKLEKTLTEVEAGGWQ